MRWMRFMALLGAALIAWGCGGDEEQGGPAGPAPSYSIDYELFETTKELDDETFDALESVADDRTSLTFTSSTALLDELETGDVLLAGSTPKTPEGLIVQVTSIEDDGDAIVLETEPVTVFHAFRRLNVRLDDWVLDGEPTELPRVPPPPLGVSSDALTLDIPPLGKPSFDEPVFDGDNLGSDEDRVNAKGKMVEHVTVTFWLTFDWQNLSPTQAASALGNLLEDLTDLFGGDPPDLGDILNLDTGLRLDGNAEVLLEVTGAASLHFDRTFVLSKHFLPWIPIGPLVFTPVVTLESHFTGGVGGQLELDYGLGADFGLGFGYHDGSIDPYLPTPSLDVIQPSAIVTATAELRTELDLRLDMPLAGFFGPYVALSAWAELALDRFESPCFELSAGLTGKTGASIGFLGKSLKNIIGPSFPIGDPLDLASGDCEPLPDPPPTDNLIEPWSKSYPGTHWGTGTDQSFSNIELSHDGRLLVSSDVGRALLKVEESGELVWAREFEMPELASPGLEPHLAVPMLDTGILVVTSEWVLVKLNQAGELEWATALEQGNYERGFRDATRRGAEVWLGGKYRPEQLEQASDAWLVGLTPDGSVAWSWTWGQPDNIDAVRRILPLDDGALVVGESRTLDHSRSRGFLLRLNADGTLRWARTVADCADSDDLILSTAILTEDGNFVVGGWFYATHTDTLLFRISPDAEETEPAWATRTGTDDIIGPEVHTIHQLPTGELRAVGLFAEPANDRVFVAGTDSIGRFAWLHTYGHEDSDTAPPGSYITKQGGLLVTAGSVSLEPHPGGFWLFEVPTPNGEIEFSSDGAVLEKPAYESVAACLTISEADTTTVEVPIVQRLVEVIAHPVTPDVHEQ